MGRISISGSLIPIALCVVALLAGSADHAAAQDRPRFAVEFSGGWVGFADDGIVSEGLIGTAARWYPLPRIAFGPEVVYLSATNHSHVIVTGNVTFDVFAPAPTGAARSVTPFLVAGGGLFRTRESFFNGTFTSNEGAFTAGGGVRAGVADDLFVGVDARVGWELHLRVNGLVEWRFGR
jgi:hypothetical protein